MGDIEGLDELSLYSLKLYFVVSPLKQHSVLQTRDSSVLLDLNNRFSFITLDQSFYF